jgi:DNA polymerase-1
MLSAYLLSPSDSKYDIEHLCLEYGVALPQYLNELGSEDKCVSYAAVLAPLFEKTNEKLKEAEQLRLLFDIELPLARVLAKMEIAGFEVDRQGIGQFGAKLTERIKELTAEIYSLAGHEFNINSPKQLA